jgi:hypothetical protein
MYPQTIEGGGNIVSTNQELPDNFSEMLVLAFEGAISEEQFALLDSYIANSSTARKYYFDFLTTYTVLYQCDSAIDIPNLKLPNVPTSEELLLEFIEKDQKRRAEREAEEARQQAEVLREEVKIKAEEAFEKFKVDERRRLEKLAYKQYRYRQIRLVLGIGAMAATLILVFLAWLFAPKLDSPPQPIAPPVVAKISRSIGAQWDRADIATMPGTQLTASNINLIRGLVQITFDSGAEVILQAPCRLELEGANQMYLQSGNLAAAVPKNAKGFTIRTPVSTVVDYGTEFGITVRASGETEAHVFKGEVDLRSGSDERVYEKSLRIKTGWSGRVDTNAKLSEQLTKSQPGRYVRTMPEGKPFSLPGERLNLADIVVGGNGFGTGKPDHYINLLTGEVTAYRGSEINQNFINQKHALAPLYLPYVDYLFVPDGGEGPVTISSTGKKFEQCPDTSGVSYCYIANGGIVRHVPGQVADLVLKRKKYGTLTNPAISMHANAGITFDLEAIRSAMPGVKIVNFNALCGVTETYYSAGDYDPGLNGTKTDFWVLVDGEIRASYTSTKGIFDGGYNININLNDQERYLTLVVTDGSNSNHTESVEYDWGMFAEPILELRPEME